MAKYKIIVGIDEAGRGPLAGAVVACAITKLKMKSEKLKIAIQNPKLLKDSKKLSAKKREEVYEVLKKCPQIKWAIGRAGERVIDKINILQATKLAMIRAVNNLTKELKNERTEKQNLLLLIDGNFGIGLPIAQKSIIKGDEKVFLIKLASIIAKVVRDRAMLREHKKYPQYGFDRHKGYPTKLHLSALEQYGPCRIHRQSFGPVINVKSQMSNVKTTSQNLKPLKNNKLSVSMKSSFEI